MKTKIQEKTSLLAVLQELSPESSKNTLKSWIEQGRVSVNDTRVSSTRQELLPGQELKVGPKAAYTEHGIKILYEDEHFVVIDKPDKLLTVATAAENEKTVHAILKRRLRRMVYPVHRLDRDTSGVMLFAYTSQARDVLKEQFASHSIDRIYMAIVEGTPPAKGTWKSTLVEDDFFFVKSLEAPIKYQSAFRAKEAARHRQRRSFIEQKLQSEASGKLAITHYEVVKQRKQTALMKFTLETGRKNQIRVHTSEAGFPILGDTKYGASANRRRLCLHAHILGFHHPFRNKKMKFVSPLPEYFASI
ncbi:MAG TPA: RluA family pseudouridine synthase [Rhabdochlamydiaceae bacterium]|nr:RluA family pseudouridine synthase [Rhabdochlamydiaceae bacterium]